MKLPKLLRVYKKNIKKLPYFLTISLSARNTVIMTTVNSTIEICQDSGHKCDIEKVIRADSFWFGSVFFGSMSDRLFVTAFLWQVAARSNPASPRTVPLFLQLAHVLCGTRYWKIGVKFVENLFWTLTKKNPKYEVTLRKS